MCCLGSRVICTLVGGNRVNKLLFKTIEFKTATFYS